MIVHRMKYRLTLWFRLKVKQPASSAKMNLFGMAYDQESFGGKVVVIEISRFTAGAAGFLSLSQCRVRPVSIRRAQALRHDALAAEPAGVAVDDIAAVLEVLDEP